MSEEPKIIEHSGTPLEIRRRINKQQNIAQARKRLVILCTNDPDGGDWLLVKPEDVPEGIKDSETMGMLVAGNIAQLPGDHLWYRAESQLEYEEKARRGFALENAPKLVDDGGA